MTNAGSQGTTCHGDGRRNSFWIHADWTKVLPARRHYESNEEAICIQELLFSQWYDNLKFKDIFVNITV